MYTHLNLKATFRIGLTTKLDIDKVVLTYRVIWKYVHTKVSKTQVKLTFEIYEKLCNCASPNQVYFIIYLQVSPKTRSK